MIQSPRQSHALGHTAGEGPGRGGSAGQTKSPRQIQGHTGAFGRGIPAKGLHEMAWAQIAVGDAVCSETEIMTWLLTVLCREEQGAGSESH